MIVAIFSAFWFGILTSISPCPLATNIAAISFLSRRLSQPMRTGLAYTFGRMASYVVLGGIIIGSLTSVPVLANFLQRYMNKALGPILLIVGLFLVDIIRFNLPSLSISQERQKKLAHSGARGAFLLGAIFALSFCPLSAGLFFGSLIPLALNNSFGFILPFFYGIGTSVPVVIFAIGISLVVRSFSRWFDKAAMLERYTRKITGAIFILIGIYFIWSHIVIGLM